MFDKIIHCYCDSFQWTLGDFVMVDNMALGHIGSPETILPPSEIGLRVIHLSTVDGTYMPKQTPQCITEAQVANNMYSDEL